MDSGVPVPSDIRRALSLSPFGVLFRYDDPPIAGWTRADTPAMVRPVLDWCDTEIGP